MSAITLIPKFRLAWDMIAGRTCYTLTLFEISSNGQISVRAERKNPPILKDGTVRVPAKWRKIIGPSAPKFLRPPLVH